MLSGLIVRIRLSGKGATTRTVALGSAVLTSFRETAGGFRWPVCNEVGDVGAGLGVCGVFVVAFKVGAGAASGTLGVPPVDGLGKPAPVAASQRILNRQVVVLQRVTRNTNAGCEFSQCEVSDRGHGYDLNPLTTPMIMGIVKCMSTDMETRLENIAKHSRVSRLVQSIAADALELFAGQTVSAAVYEQWFEDTYQQRRGRASTFGAYADCVAVMEAACGGPGSLGRWFETNNYIFPTIR